MRFSFISVLPPGTSSGLVLVQERYLLSTLCFKDFIDVELGIIIKALVLHKKQRLTAM